MKKPALVVTKAGLSKQTVGDRLTVGRPVLQPWKSRSDPGSPIHQVGSKAVAPASGPKSNPRDLAPER